MNDIQTQPSEHLVLLIDDDDHVRRTLERVCGLIEGVLTLSASNVADGYRMFEDTSIDLIITDLSMPDETGLGLLKRVRGGGSDIPVMVFSGSFTPGTREKAQELGATEILNKPANIETLMATIRRLLGIDDSPTEGQV